MVRGPRRENAFVFADPEELAPRFKLGTDAKICSSSSKSQPVARVEIQNTWEGRK